MNPQEQNEMNLRATAAQMAMAINTKGPVDKVLKDAALIYAYIKGSSADIKVASPTPILSKPVLV